MNKIIIFLLLSSSFLFGYKVEIDAQKVTADDNKGVTTFTGNVTIKRGQDIMKADNIVVYVNKNKDVEKFQAKGNASIYIVSTNGNIFKGESGEFVYWPLKQIFKLSGNAIVEDMTNKRKLIGDEIVFDEKTKKANVTGKESKPVKVIFNVADKKK
ncbi:MAG: lipopolysaccharide transport periplasmic protein LptA [Campylobacterales bacterium]|nr:lipopolysaccharide transport periplasmic protein LptA [Campylobacterales bacterium]